MSDDSVARRTGDWLSSSSPSVGSMNTMSVGALLAVLTVKPWGTDQAPSSPCSSTARTSQA